MYKGFTNRGENKIKLKHLTIHIEHHFLDVPV